MRRRRKGATPRATPHGLSSSSVSGIPFASNGMVSGGGNSSGSGKTHVRAAAALLLPSVLQVAGELCDNGLFCAAPKVCCGTQCCPVESAGESQTYGFYHLSFWNMWYFWFIVIFLIISCFGGCGYWRQRHLYMSSNSSRSRRSRRGSFDEDSVSTDAHDSSYPSYQFAPHGTFPAPPPYSEVAAKPDMYPLVMGGADFKEDLLPYTYINTPYIHSYMQFTSGPLYPSSPVDSTCSSLPFSTNPSNSIYPPPYTDGACAVSSVSTPGSMSAYTPTDVSSIHYGPGSPPVATTPSSQHMLSQLPTPSDMTNEQSLPSFVPSPSISPSNHERILSAIVANIQNMTSSVEASFANDDVTSHHATSSSEMSVATHSVGEVESESARRTPSRSTPNSSRVLPTLIFDSVPVSHRSASCRGASPATTPHFPISNSLHVLYSPPDPDPVPRNRSVAIGTDERDVNGNGGSPTPSHRWQRRRPSGHSEGHSPISDLSSSLSHSRLFSRRSSQAEDKVNLVECAVETDGFDDS